MYLIPKPKTLESREGYFYLSYRSRIVISPQIKENRMVYASVLKECLQTFTGFSLDVTAGVMEEGDIALCLSKELSFEAYQIEVRENGITLWGGDGAGVFYAVQTLCQMAAQCGSELPCVWIKDAPDLKHRGYYLDVTRGRVPKLSYLKKVADRLCRYKINEFQLYVEHTYMFAGLSEMWRDETPLTAEEILELDKYCRERHVELIPSLASFGHLYMLLSTKTYGDLCELENSDSQPFSFSNRMRHHTVNVSDDRVLPLIKSMLEAYMALFSSDKFNICADETFDLGKGKSKQLAEKKGVHRIYIDYVKELCAFVKEKGKQPMFWGDIICGEPQLVKELPEEVICLTWGYAPDVSDDASRKMAQTKVKQYLCPGVSGWNQWMNQIGDSYQNIVRMCTYAKKYNAIGILNTDWGDFGHINHPEFSVPGMIYGAAFSWNQEIIPFEEMNRQIARVEFHDTSEKLVALLADIAEQTVFHWWDAVMYYEIQMGKEWKTEVQEKETLSGEQETSKEEQNLLMEKLRNLQQLASTGKMEQSNASLEELRRQLKRTSPHMDSSGRKFLQACDIAADGIEIWNEIGAALAGSKGIDRKLAERLETWFMSYKEMWREISKEGDLSHIAEIVFWYADLLRGRKQGR